MVWVVLLASAMWPLAAASAGTDCRAASDAVGSACADASLEAAGPEDGDAAPARAGSPDEAFGEGDPCRALGTEVRDAFGAYLLGNMLAEGTQCVRDDAEAAEWYLIAAGQGLVAAQLAIGQLHLEGRGVERDLEQAIHWFGIASDSAFAEASKLGPAASGEGDPCRALETEVRDAFEAYLLGNLLAEGTQCIRNDGEAARLYVIAANQGVISAQLAIGQLYLQGRGVEQDLEQAIHWFGIANDSALAEARELRLAAYSQLLLDDPEGGIAPDEIPFLHAVIHDRRNVIHDYLALGLDVDRMRNVSGSTALMIAVSKGSQDLVRLLLRHGASPDLQEENGYTALHVAVTENRPEMLAILLEHGANSAISDVSGYTPLQQSIARGAIKMLGLLISGGADPDHPGEVGVPPIYLAVDRNRVDASRILLDAGADVDARWQGATALQVAVYKGEHELAELLVDRCADVRVRTSHGASLRALAAGNADFEMIRILRRPCVDGVNGQPE